jgi:hypothetical protein
MMARLPFFFITAFWVVMNILLWRAEYGSHGGEIPVPVELVWRKILTAPDASTLSIYQDGERNGFCEFSTSVEQAMANLDGDNPPPEGLPTRAGYQIHLTGNMGLDNFTNRLQFDGLLKFTTKRAWRELNLKFSTRTAEVDIGSDATNQIVHLQIIMDGAKIERNFTFADLQNPATLWRSLTGDFTGGLASGLALPVPTTISSSFLQNIHWHARRDRLKIGGEMVSVYRLETEFLQNRVVIYTSTLGDILRVELPGGIIARLDQWSKS